MNTLNATPHTKSYLPLTLAALLSFPSAGCFVPKSASMGRTDSGQALSYRTKRLTHEVKEREVIGSTDHYNSDGNYVGTSESTREVTKTKQGRSMTFFYQGNTEIGEADYYRFGNDLEGERLANEKQSKLWWMNGASLGLVAVGVGGTIATATGAFGEGGLSYSYGYLGSSLVILGGSYLFKHVFQNRDAARLPLSRAEAIQTAAR